jgi:parvulin-like peptidyl-prolyl isomerase
MTSPTQPPKESLKGRISRRLSTDDKGRLIDADAQHTRNVSWLFYGLIAATVVVIVVALGFGFWESNLKPMANVDGTDVSRAEWNDRQKLEQFRAERAESQVSTALAAGVIDADLADRRFITISNEAPTSDAEVMTDLVDLLYKQQLAAGEGIELSSAELDEALTADGTFPETRQIEALIVLTEEQQAGETVTEAGIADARARAEAALADLRAGADYEELAVTYGPANAESGYISQGDISDAAWSDAMFALEAEGITDVFQAATGEQLIGVVTQIVPVEADADFIEAVNDEVGEEIHSRNVELEATATKLEEQVTTEALEAEYPQVDLAEILIERSPSNPDDAAGEARVSHILYTPETALDEDGVPTAVADLPEDDPAWAAAQSEAELTSGLMRAVDDVDTRKIAFAARAARDSDGPSGPSGGDLGYFPQGAMVPTFDEAVWEAVDLQHGDIIGPVRTDFGWHVILFDEFRSSLDVRVSEAQAALAEEGAEFATVAAELSDGVEAAEGGQTGWQRLDDLDEMTTLALAVLEPGETTEPIDDFDGARIYQLLDEATLPLEPAEAALLAETAFADWYDDLYFTAQGEGRISIDDSVYEGTSSAPAPVSLPAGGHGG